MDRQQILTEMGIETWIVTGNTPGDSSDSNNLAVQAKVNKQDSNALREFESSTAVAHTSSVTTEALLTEAEQGLDELDTPLISEHTEDSLDKLVSEVLSCRKCQLCDTRKHAVPGLGNSKAKWMFVGEAPGAEEDRRGEPFVGRAGQLLDNIIRALGMDRKDVYIANVLKCRPPNNRDVSSYHSLL